MSKGAVFIDYVEASGGNAAAARPSTAAKPVAKKAVGAAARPVGGRPATAIGKSKSVAASSSAAGADETSVTANEDLSGANDPIASAMQERLKAGGVSSVVKEIDAKKKGMPMNKHPKHTSKIGALLNLVKDDASSAASTKATSTASRSIAGSSKKVSASPSPAKRAGA